jgi:hypothetical protein
MVSILAMKEFGDSVGCVERRHNSVFTMLVTKDAYGDAKIGESYFDVKSPSASAVFGIVRVVGKDPALNGVYRLRGEWEGYWKLSSIETEFHRMGAQEHFGGNHPVYWLKGQALGILYKDMGISANPETGSGIEQPPQPHKDNLPM